MPENSPTHLPDGDAAVPNDGVDHPVVSRGLAGALDQRLAACPSVRAEVIAAARAHLASDHPPSDDEVAEAVVTARWSTV